MTDHRSPQFEVGDRVRRAVYRRFSLQDVIGWKTGKVERVYTALRGVGEQDFYLYEVAWDDGSTQSGYSAATLEKETVQC